MEQAPEAEAAVSSLTQRTMHEQRANAEICYSFIADEAVSRIVTEFEQCVSEDRQVSPPVVAGLYRRVLAGLFLSVAVNHAFCAESSGFRAEFHSRVAMSTYGEQKDRDAAAKAREAAARWRGAAERAATNVQTLLTDAADRGDPDDLSLLSALYLQPALSVHDPNRAADYAYRAALGYLAAGKRDKAVSLVGILDDVPEGRALASRLRSKLYD